MNNLPGQDHELAFWKGFVKSDRFLNGWLPDDVKTPDLVQEVADFFLAHPDAEVLDCGSGAVSILRGTVPASNLLAIDPLGEEYEKLFDYAAHNVSPPLAFACEELEGVLWHEQFDIVHISNALDHTQNPAQAYIRLLGAIQPGGHLVIQGFVNEATHENWQGMHQYNINIDGKYFQIKSKSSMVLSVRTDSPLVHTAKKITLPTGREWFIFIFQKGETK